MTKYISGHNKLVVFGYLNDTISTEIQARETRFLLDFICSLKDIPVRMLLNPTQSQINEKEYKVFTINVYSLVRHPNHTY